VTRLQRDVTQIYKLWKDKYEKADRVQNLSPMKESMTFIRKQKRMGKEIPVCVGI
jgi:hypothetical protein